MRPYAVLTFLIGLTSAAVFYSTGLDSTLSTSIFLNQSMAATPEPQQPELIYPDPKFTPSEVVRLQMEAMQQNDQPVKDAGVATAFRFASPGNRAATGPLLRFSYMVHGPQYRDLLDCRSFSLGKLKIGEGVAMQVVKVIASDGTPVYYGFQLSKQKDAPYENCWMTDAVIKLEKEFS